MQAHNHKYSTTRHSVGSKRHFGARCQNLQHNERIWCIQAYSQYFTKVSASPDRPVQTLWWHTMMCLLLHWKTGTENVSFMKSWFFFPWHYFSFSLSIDLGNISFRQKYVGEFLGDPGLSPSRARVQPIVGELRFHKLHREARKKRKKEGWREKGRKEEKKKIIKNVILFAASVSNADVWAWTLGGPSLTAYSQPFGPWFLNWQVKTHLRGYGLENCRKLLL